MAWSENSESWVVTPVYDRGGHSVSLAIKGKNSEARHQSLVYWPWIQSNFSEIPLLNSLAVLTYACIVDRLFRTGVSTRCVFFLTFFLSDVFCNFQVSHEVKFLYLRNCNTVKRCGLNLYRQDGYRSLIIWIEFPVTLAIDELRKHSVTEGVS